VRNPDEKLGDRTQGRTYLPDHLIRVNDAAKRSRQTRFTALLHHVDEKHERAHTVRGLLGGNAQSDGSPDLHVIKTIDNSMMIVGPVGEAYYFAIDAALSAI